MTLMAKRGTWRQERAKLNKTGIVAQLRILLLGRQREVDPWGSMASYSSLLDLFQNIETCSVNSNKVKKHRRNSQDVSWPPQFTHTCTHMCTCVY